MNPEYWFLGSIIIGLTIAFWALRSSTNADVELGLNSLKLKSQKQEAQIQLLLERMAEMQMEITRLRATLDLQEQENKLMRAQVEQYQRKLQTLGLSEK